MKDEKYLIYIKSLYMYRTQPKLISIKLEIRHIIALDIVGDKKRKFNGMGEKRIKF